VKVWRMGAAALTQTSAKGAGPARDGGWGRSGAELSMGWGRSINEFSYLVLIDCRAPYPCLIEWNEKENFRGHFSTDTNGLCLVFFDRATNQTCAQANNLCVVGAVQRAVHASWFQDSVWAGEPREGCVSRGRIVEDW
jgi:hypothetical protein